MFRGAITCLKELFIWQEPTLSFEPTFCHSWKLLISHLSYFKLLVTKFGHNIASIAMAPVLNAPSAVSPKQVCRLSCVVLSVQWTYCTLHNTNDRKTNNYTFPRWNTVHYTTTDRRTQFSTLFCRSTVAPAWRSFSTTLSWPSWLAIWRGQNPSCVHMVVCVVLCEWIYIHVCVLHIHGVWLCVHVH